MVPRWIYLHATLWKSGHALPARLINAKVPLKAEPKIKLRKEFSGTAQCMFKMRTTTYCTTWHINARGCSPSCDRLSPESLFLSICAPSTNHDLRYGRRMLAFSHARANAWTRGFEAIPSSRISVPGSWTFFNKVFNNVSLVVQNAFLISRCTVRLWFVLFRTSFWMHSYISMTGVDYCRQPTEGQSDQDMMLDVGESHQPTSVQIQRLASLKAVEGTLSRLNRLGVTIRQSSGAKAITRARRYAETLDLDYFTSLCSAAVQFLYSGAHQSLKAHLSRLMTALYARIQHLESRRRNLETRRTPPPRLATINEAPADVNATAGSSRQEAILPVFRQIVQPRSRGPMSQSDLSSVHMSHILDRLRVPEQASTTFPKTFSIRVNQANYPRPPKKEGKPIRCKWCSAWLREEDLVGSAWRYVSPLLQPRDLTLICYPCSRHVDRDLKPYACLAEQCTEADTVFPSFEAWFKHMQLHGQRWHQKNYRTISWSCVVCGDRQVYNNPQDLCSHMEKLHQGTFSPSHLPAVARQSRVEHRAANNCLLCCFTIEPEEEVKQEAGLLKRPGARQTGEGTKRARISRSMTSPGAKTVELDLADSTSSSDSDEQEATDISGLSRTMARHIAAHLQSLMLVTLRLDEVQNRDDNACDEVQSNDAEFDEDHSIPANDDSRQSSDIVSPNGSTMGRDDESAGVTGKATVMDCDNTTDHVPIPDTNLDLSDVPRSCDNLAPEDDRLMAQIIEDKAFQSWTDPPEAVSATARRTMRSALEDFEKVITQQDFADYHDYSLERFRQEALEIENQLNSRGLPCNMRRLKPLFTGLEDYSKVVETLCNGTAYLPWISAPITMALRIASEDVQSFDLLIEAYDRIGSVLQRFDLLNNPFVWEDPRFHETIAAFYADILDFHKHTYKIIRRSGQWSLNKSLSCARSIVINTCSTGWQLLFYSSWGRFERRFANILENMMRHADLIDRLVNAINFSETRQLCQELYSWREQSLQKISLEDKRQLAEEFYAIQSWLQMNDCDQIAIFDSIDQSTKHPGTCSWILNNRKFKSWSGSSPQTPILWLSGVAGSGKSVISSQLINFVRSRNEIVLYHFCTNTSFKSSEYDQVLKSLVEQLLRQDEDLTAYVYFEYILNRRAASLPILEELEELLQTLLIASAKGPSQHSYIWIVLDGVDELREHSPNLQARLLNFVKKIVSETADSDNVTCKAFISGRQSTTLSQAFRQKPTVSLSDEKIRLGSAIREYALQRLRPLETRFQQLGFNALEIESIGQQIAIKSDGECIFQSYTLHSSSFTTPLAFLAPIFNFVKQSPRIISHKSLSD